MSSLDIVIPIYNSQATINELLQKLSKWSTGCSFQINLILIDDNSRDETSNTIISICSELNLPYQLIRLSKNYGQHTATAVGFYHSNADYVLTMDDDLQHKPEEISKLIDCAIKTKSDLVYAAYDRKKHHFIRNLGTFMLKRIILLSGKDYSMVSSFRLIKSHVIQPYKLNISQTAYIDERLLNNASHPTTCMVMHQNRADGKSGYSPLKLIKMALTILLLHSSFPLIIISRMGLILSFVFFVIGCYYIYEKVMYDVALGFTSLIVAIFFSTGLILLSLGTIGEYIRKLWVNNQQLNNVIIESHCKSSIHTASS